MEIKKKELKASYKTAGMEIKQKNLAEVKAQVGLVLDISKSIYPLFRDGIMQKVIERILALAMHFDDDQRIDMFVFGTAAVKLPSVSVQDFDGYAKREIMAKHKINGATKYATALQLIKECYSKPETPVFIIFVTDGGNSDKKESEELIRELSSKPVFIQFIGIGKEDFPFLRKLDDLKGRFIDNAGFMHVNDIAIVPDKELYNRILNEFPDWLKLAKRRLLI
ncbi:MAG: VWA domain-containing protein [Gammaproteobacteria bacterium]|nr:VWA domain-containing protein [Gammaproteobacteria bacterium]